MSAMSKEDATMNEGELCDSDKRCLRAMQQMFHARSVAHGWYDGSEDINPDRFGAKIALIMSEAAEALEAYRDGILDNTGEWRTGAKPVGVASELADIVIRVGDLAEWMGIDLGEAIAVKHRFNGTRPYRHGNKVL